MRNTFWTIVFALSNILAAYTTAYASESVQQAPTLLQAAGAQGGLIVHLGCGDGHLTAALHADGRYLVQGLDANAENVEQARDYLRSKNLYGKVTADVFDGATLPYITNLVNGLVDSTEDGQVSSEEILRVLAPNGVVVVRRSSLDTRSFSGADWQPTPAGDLGEKGGWVAFRKSWPDEIDEWTHWLHGPDNNAVSRDTTVGISRHLQWIMPPLWARHHNLLPSVSAMVSSRGRLYYIIDEGAIAVKGLPDKWHLVARDGFNGLTLWKRPIENWGWRRWSDIEFSGVMRFKGPSQLYRRLVAVDDVVYVTLGFDEPVVALNGATGETIREYAGTENTAEILHQNGFLLLVRNAAADDPGKEVLAVDAQSGTVLWRSKGYRGTSGRNDELRKYTDAYLTAGDDAVFFIDGDDIVALELTAGKELWRRPRPEMEKNVLGHYQFNHANLCTLVFHDGVLLLGQMYPFPDNLNARQQKEMVLLAVNAATGEKLWDFTGMSLAHFTPPDLFVNNDLVWTMKPKEVSLLGLDIRTGEIKKEYPAKDMLVGHHHRCYRNKATQQFYLAGEEGIEYIDFHTGELDVHHWMRGACAYGIMPANGCIYLPTHSCGCHNNAKLNGFIALTARGVPEISDSQKPRLQKGPAFAYDGDGKPTSVEDWPVFKRDNRRSNYVPTDVPAELSQEWAKPLGGQLTPLVVAGGKLFIASQETHQLCCLDAETGETRWQRTTNGSLDTPPAFCQGRLIFGTRAGYICALRADDGELIWRFRAAPEDYRLTAFGSLESPWPVHGSVLVLGDRVYCVAGRSMHLNSGLYMYVLDVNTGEILQQRQLVADTSTKGELSGAVLPDILVSDGSFISMRTMRFNADDISARPADAAGGTLAANDGGLRDGTWFNSAFWVYGKSRGQMLVFDDQTVYGIQAYDKFITKSYPHDIFTPGTGYRLVAADNRAGRAEAPGKSGKRRGGKPAPVSKWEHRVAVRGQAMVVTNQHLFLAGAPDVVDKTDPWAAFENRKGCILSVFSKEDGKKLGEYPLDSAPVHDGMAAADGRLYLSMLSGTVVCLAGGDSRP